MTGDAVIGQEPSRAVIPVMTLKVTKTMKKISIVLDQTEQVMILLSMMEMAVSEFGTQAGERYMRLYRNFREAIINSEEVNDNEVQSGNS